LTTCSRGAPAISPRVTQRRISRRRSSGDGVPPGTWKRCVGTIGDGKAKIPMAMTDDDSSDQGGCLTHWPDVLIRPHGATWRSGYAAVCKTVYSGSIPDVASINKIRDLGRIFGEN